MKKCSLFIWSVVFLLGMQPVMATMPGKDSPGETAQEVKGALPGEALDEVPGEATGKLQSQDPGEVPGMATGEDLQVLCSPDLYLVMQECTKTYNSLEGGNVRLQLLGDRKVNEWINDPGHMALLTKYHMERLDPRQSKIFVVGREVYVPVTHPENPYLEQIRQRGISPKEFALMYTAGQQITWGELLQDVNDSEVHAYRTIDPTFTTCLADFAEMEQDLVGGKVLQSCDMVVDAVCNDRYGIGFCTLSQLQHMQEDEELKKLAMVPVDLNANDQMDHFEEIYGDVEALHRGIWIGKYTSSLYSRIFAVGSGGSLGDQERTFLQWLAEDGQEILAKNGYSTLLGNEQETLLASLEGAPIIPADAGEESRGRLALVIAIIVAGLGILIYLVLRRFNEKKPTPESIREAAGSSFISESSEVPGGYYFNRTHTWAFQERDGNIRVGLDSFIEKLTGPITRIEMKDRGEHVRKGQTIFTLVQNGKRMDIQSPVSGKIFSHNEKLQVNAGLVNSSPFSEGWVYIIEPTNWVEEFESLFRAPKYREWIKSEFARLKDFLAALSHSTGKTTVVLQDGGEIRDGILEDLGPEAWDDFQTDFLRN